MDSKVTYLIIKEGGHICASSLDTKMSSTPTFTLKGIVIQLMSFVLSIESDR
jgi:ubiquitin-protein ligase